MSAEAGPPAREAASPARTLLTDRPELYEARFPDPGRLAGRWAEGLSATARRGTAWLDMGCGTGRDAAHLHAAGRRVTAADLSEPMLAYARTRHPGAEYVRADLHGCDFGTDVFDAVVCLDSALLYCHTNEQLDRFLSCCRRALSPGGLLVAEMRRRVLGRSDRPARRPAGCVEAGPRPPPRSVDRGRGSDGGVWRA
ncbi:2-methoxy-6-polyprenyl-1,4-benzoquinol methylase, mitochondrial [Streptomyces griseoloalbus]